MPTERVMFILVRVNNSVEAMMMMMMMMMMMVSRRRRRRSAKTDHFIAGATVSL